MKKITLLLLCLTVSFWSYSQCTSTAGGNYGNLVMANDGTAEQIAVDNWPNAEYSVIQGLVVGNTYTVTGTNTTSIYITVTETTPAIDAIGTTIVFGASTVNFTATTAQILIFWNLDVFCNTQASDDTVTTIQCTSASCSCTANSAPDAVTLTAPTNGEMNVSTSANTNVGPFTWTDGAGAGIDSYTISIGLNAAGDDIGTIPFANGDSINYAWADGTTYFWSITAINCFGSTSSAVFSFTTDSCTETAVPPCTTEIAPTDGNLSATTGAGVSISFEWAENAGEFYELFINGFSQGTRTSPTVLTGFAYDTAYTWQVVPFNCFGEATGCATWNFTTESDPALSVDEFESNTLFSVFPNPAKDTVTIKTDLTINTVEVINMLGQRVNMFEGNSITNNTINISNLDNGFYFLNIDAEGKKQSIRIIKE